MKNDPKSVGERSEGQVVAAFLKAGKVVLCPLGDNQRYDLVLDEGGKFVRVQCKTGRVERGAIVFNTRSVNWYTHESRDYKGQADLFAVYVPDLDKVYVIPVATVGVTACNLRLEPPKNGQTKNIRLARDFEFK